MDARARIHANNLKKLCDVKNNGANHNGYSFKGVDGNASGITKLLQAAYYPNYRYRGGDGRSGKFVRSKGPRGMRRGTMVDVQIRGVVKLMASGKSWKPTKTTHPMTIKFVQALKVLNLEPVAAQVLVGDPGLRLGTGVDLVAMDSKTGKLVVVELKVGFDTYVDKGTGRMKFEMRGYSNAPRYQHQAQLSCTTELFRRTFGIEPQTSFVLVANNAGVSYHELENGIRFLGPILLTRLASTRAQK